MNLYKQQLETWLQSLQLNKEETEKDQDHNDYEISYYQIKIDTTPNYTAEGKELLKRWHVELKYYLAKKEYISGHLNNVIAQIANAQASLKEEESNA